MMPIARKILNNSRRYLAVLSVLLLILTLSLRLHRAPNTVYLTGLDTVTVQMNRRGDTFRVLLDSSMLLEKTVQTKKRDPKFKLVPSCFNVSRPRSGTFDQENIVDRWSMLTIVKSKFENRERRNTIRQTWGGIKYMDGFRLETVFLLGATENGDQQREILKESRKFEDILQVELTDSYKNISLKTIAGMKWAADNIPSHWLYSSADDDMILHPANFVQYIENTIISRALSSITSLPKGIVNLQVLKIEELPIMCVYSFKTADAPVRDPGSKWFISEELYPANYWPMYCKGGWYSMPMATVSKLYKISRDTAFIHLDDVWITGVLRIKIINRFNVPKHPVMLLEQEGIVDAPLSKRSNYDLYYNANEDDLNKVLVSHAWGNYGWFRSDIPSRLKERWEKWEKSVFNKIKFFVRV